MGTPIPTDEPDPFPEQDADIIREQAAYLDTIAGLAVTIQLLPFGPAAPMAGAAVAGTVEANMETFLDGIKEILGDYTKSRDLALRWAELANVPTDIRADLVDHMGALDDYWEGVAFDSFSGHLDEVALELKATKEKMVTIATTLADAITLVIDTWASAIGFIGKCALNIAGSINPISISGALQSFAADVNDLVEKAGKIMGGYTEDIAKLQVHASSFPTLPGGPEALRSAGNTDGWDVRPAPEA